MVNLTLTDIETEDDRIWGFDYWAKLFKAKTWEELNMIAKKVMNCAKLLKLYMS